MCYIWRHLVKTDWVCIYPTPPLQTSSSSSCHATSTDIPDPLSPLFPIFITSGRSSGLHSVSSHSCWMYVHAGCPAFARPYVGIHRSTSLMKDVINGKFLSRVFFTQSLLHEQDVITGQFYSRVQLVWIESFPSLRLVAQPWLNDPFCFTIFPRVLHYNLTSFCSDKINFSQK